MGRKFRETVPLKQLRAVYSFVDSFKNWQSPVMTKALD
jgi:hypothetical protein